MGGQGKSKLQEKKDRENLTNIIRRAVRIIKSGGVVAFPTETVYGIGASTFSRKGIRKIYKLKGRPADNPLIVHISDERDIYKVARDVPEKALKLASKFWPGPLTLILKKRRRIPHEATGGLDTVAVRMPAHPIALKLIKESGVPIAAPSANISGKPSPTKSEHVRKYFGEKVFIIDGGETKYGIESTVVDLTSSPPRILRSGAITKEEIEKTLEEKVEVTPSSGKEAKKMKSRGDKHEVRSPGMKYKHYSPDARLIVVRDRKQLKKTLEKLISEKKLGEEKTRKKMGYMTKKHRETKNDEKIGAVVLYRKGIKLKDDVRRHFDFFLSGRNANEVAKNLFDLLIRLDEKYDTIVFEGVEEKGVGVAVMDRLRKASSEER